MTSPTGLPALAALTVGGVAFLIAVIVARLRRGAVDTGPQRRSPRSLAGVLVQMAGFVVVAIGITPPTLDPLSAAALGEALVVALLMAGAVALFVWASRTMGRNWSIVARMRSDHALVTTGPFAHVRHPIYSGMTLTLLALALAFGTAPRLIVALPLFALGTWLRIAEEERLLAERFGEAYAAYAARVRRFLPGLF